MRANRSSCETLGLTVLGTLLMLTGGVACSGDPEVEEPEDEFADGSGQEMLADQAPYPTGPYGYHVGSVVADLGFIGYVNPQVEMGTPHRRIELSDFDNPTGDALWGPDAPYPEGTPKPVALMMDLSAVWCPPCQYEAESVLPGKHRQYAPAGVVMCNLAESVFPGTPASAADLDAWATRYSVEYPLVLDPRYRLSLLNPQPAWPGNFIIDTRTMTLVAAMAGVPEADFWQTFDDVIAGTHR